MRKMFKIILIVVAVLLIAVVVAFGIIFLDVAAYTATGSENLPPTGTPVGTALVVYDPGLSGTAQNVARQIATDIQTHGYNVTFAGIKSGAAAATSGYNVIVVGGPIYAGTPTASVKDFLANLNPSQGVKRGVFGSGSGPQEASDIEMIQNAISGLPNGNALSGAVVVKIGSGENLTVRSSDFVAELLQ